VGTKPREVEPREQTARYAVKRTHGICKISRQSEPCGELSDAAKYLAQKFSDLVRGWTIRPLVVAPPSERIRLRPETAWALGPQHIRAACERCHIPKPASPSASQPPLRRHERNES